MNHRVCAVTLAALLAAIAAPASASADYFLKIGGVDGESTDDKHKGEIDIQSFSWGASNPSTVSTGASGVATGKRMHKPMTITKPLDRGSVIVRYAVARESSSGMSTGRATACAQGQHIASATVGSAAQRWELKDVIVTSCAADGMTLDYQGIQAVQ